MKFANPFREGRTSFENSELAKHSENEKARKLRASMKKAKNARGGKRIGVCSSIEGAFFITEELDSSSGKDTSRLLLAGTRKVFWLRVLEER